mgnify:CR=1 FL=1
MKKIISVSFQECLPSLLPNDAIIIESYGVGGLPSYQGSGFFDVIALVLPLIFVRPILTIAEFFRKKGA